ncbi:hypothetical protein HWV62_39124 [Athelia sp. TMB]|nr:hypothetical protein HWV62_39124 [Athelia sp. TMB]
MTQVVNSLTSKSEIGGPMAAMYLLENPDHYTSHEFRPCYWKHYVREARRVWEDQRVEADEDVEALDEDDKKVVLGKQGGEYIGLSRVDDYVMRPEVYQDVPLYQ